MYHVSENPQIKVFEPLPAPNPEAGVEGKAVWAIDEFHLVNYLLPRDCPRITYGVSASTSAEDLKRFFREGQKERRVIIVEDAWLERIKNTTLHLYQFDPSNFQMIDEGAGYYISRQTVIPVSCEPVSNLIDEILKRRAIFETLPNLWEKIDEVAKSTLEFSIIRKRNALPRERSL